ncbi:hypothetical protein MPSEU_000717300 [Mayamaea pseudoterrestris]|nr:hypothetical protein MPSEU_000717300 [Mayamaea pseudoterrestris]
MLSLRLVFLYVLGLLLVPDSYALAFASTLFQERPTLQQKAPSKSDGVDIELPDFEELFSRMEAVSPLLRNVINRKNGGFATVEDATDLPWRRVESHKTGSQSVRSIDRIDNFQGHPAPLLRVRATIQGPCVGQAMTNFIMDCDERKKWDDQIDQVYEIYPINDLDYANMAMGYGKFGECSRLGVGYCKTKPNLGVDSREQLTLCGCQDFLDGACIIWGVELEAWHDYMFPPTERHTRAKSRLFSTTMQPTGKDSFDVEYILQLEIGGKIPQWISTPLVVKSIKQMFQHASNVYGGDDIHKYLEKE